MLNQIVEAIKKLGNGVENACGSGDVTEPNDDDECCDNDASEDKEQEKINDGEESCESTEDSAYHRPFFCCEDTFSSKDINVEVEGVGQLSFPISHDCIWRMIKISKKAKFGKGEKTLTDTNVRNTQVIPATKLKVSIAENSLSGILKRIKTGLNIRGNDIIKPHLYNMLIYGPGQFFKKHQDTEKIPNMIATLIIVLPSAHNGGDLIIEHNKNSHIFFGSKNSDFIKCVSFYADCRHEVKKVIEGYRVALTFNVVMEPSGIMNNLSVNKRLNKAVQKYFEGENHPVRFIYFLNHMYTKHSLKWNLLKGTDRSQAQALFDVAKKQGGIPYLALADHYESRSQKYYNSDYSEVWESSTELYFWIDERNLNVDECNFNNNVSDNEACSTINTSDLLDPYKTEKQDYTGNEGVYRDFWYHRACVVIFADEWLYKEGYKSALCKLFPLTGQTGNEEPLLDQINKAGNKFLNYKYWKDPIIADMLLRIVIYLKNKEKAVQILSHLPGKLLVVDKIDLFLELETMYDVETWYEILKNWTCNPSWPKIFDAAIPFIVSYKKVATKNEIPNFLVTSNWVTLEGYKLALNELYCSTLETGNTEFLQKKIEEAGGNFLNYNHWKDSSVTYILLKIIIRLNNSEKAVAVLSCLLKKLLDVSRIEILSQLEAQYDTKTWNLIMENWKKCDSSEFRFHSIDVTAIEFIKKYKASVQNSVLPEFLLSEIISRFINESCSIIKLAMYYEIDDSTIVKLCILLKVCEEIGYTEGKKKLLKHVLSYPAVCQAAVLYKLQNDMAPVKFVEYQGLRNHVINLIDKDLSQVDCSSWTIPLKISCTCDYCIKVNKFFESKAETKIVVQNVLSIREHIRDKMYGLDTNYLTIPIKLISPID